MCGRYFLNIELDKLANRYNIKDIPNELLNYQGEIFPSNDAPVVYNDENGRKISLMNWGFRTSYSNNLVINARSETVHKKNLFKESFHTRRCLIPVTGFYEWKKVNDEKEKYFIKEKGLILSLCLFGLTVYCSYLFIIATTWGAWLSCKNDG